MIDFLRANTWCSREEYTWRLTVGQIRLAAFDFSHVDYSRQREMRSRSNGDKKTKPKGKSFKIGNLQDVMNLTSLGIPTINK